MEGLLQDVVGHHAATHVGIAYVGTDVQGLGLVNDGTEQVTPCNGHTVETGLNLVVGVLGEHTLIGHEAVAVELVADTELAALAQRVGRTGTADEVVAAQRGVTCHGTSGVVVVTYLEGMAIVVVVVVGVLQEDVLLCELAATKAEVGVEIPILVGHRGADAGIGDRGTALQRGEVAVIVGSVGHHACTNGEVHVLLVVVNP